MKVSKLILILLFFVINVFGQTKKETEEWINRNINDYPVSYGKIEYNILEKIFVEDGYLFFYLHWKKNDEKYYSGSWNKVALKDIKSIEYSKDTSIESGNKWFEINFNFNKGKCYEAKPDNEYEGKNNLNYSLVSERTKITKRFNMEFANSEIKNRIEKALVYIIKINGGKVIVKKEPF